MFVNLANLKVIEGLYETYKVNPKSVDPTWRAFFDGVEFLSDTASVDLEKQCNVLKLIEYYRSHGFKFADNNPLVKKNVKLDWKLFDLTDSDLNSIFYSDKILKKNNVSLDEIITQATKIYSNRIGFDFEHCNENLKFWIRNKIENSFSLKLSKEKKYSIVESLVKADIFESFLNTKYSGQTRFSIEGAESLIPIMFEIIDEEAKKNTTEIVIGMSHRGRLNVLSNVLEKPYSIMFHEFEESYSPFPYEGKGDVKHHKGFSKNINRNGKTVNIQLCANPSHLESVNSVVLGLAYAKQIFNKKNHTLSILIHGDAAFASQGVIYESLQLMSLKNYSVGGTLHIIVNNQIGYTTSSLEGKSTLNSTDIAKSFGIPVFHINAEDPESCIAVVPLAMEIIYSFKVDVILDLICYRKYGHNEGDEPIFTQPVEYDIIRKKESIYKLYRNLLIEKGELEKKAAEQLEKQFVEKLNHAYKQMQNFKEEIPDPKEMIGDIWLDYSHQPQDELFKSFETAVDEKKLKEQVISFSKIPEQFNLHPKLKKWVDTRVDCTQKDVNEKCIDWAFAEMLSFSSLLVDQFPIRLAGQDSKRGTFNQRHLMWIDQKTAKEYYPLNNIGEKQAFLEIVNSPLSEFASLGFEYGYSLGSLNSLVMWEAQFGDFYNGAQVLIDQYLVAAEEKWCNYSSLVLLLPHGYEGQGPEHSSARIERFLQLSANGNIQVANPSTPAQYFHILRRQCLRKLKKPLIIFTPKSLLRNALCKSSIQEFASGTFEEILEETSVVSDHKKLIFCSGKVFYDLISEREKRNITNCKIIRIEQLYPLRTDKLKIILEKYQDIEECFWVQEEPENMGAWNYIFRPLQMLVSPLKLIYIGREESASPAVGSRKQHKEELSMFLNKVFE